MGEVCGSRTEGSYAIRKVRVSALAARQFGWISAWQLRRIGVSRSTVQDWTKAAYLHRELPGVYAVGHRARSVEGDLAAALLYAGPGAMLSHGTAAWWLGLLDSRPSINHISTPRGCRSRKGFRVHARRDLARIWHKGLPATSVAQTLLDFAATASPDRVRFALANADYHALLDLAAIEELLGQGRPGTTTLRAALKRHQPRLALTRSALERAFIEFCETNQIPLPEVNVRVEGWLVDAVWRDQRVVVELDGHKGHRSAAQLERDHQRDLTLRAAGFTVVRYTYHQLIEQAIAIAAELRSLLNLAVLSGEPGSR
jgi:predicted transcriptional regulator of viral defense system